MIRTLLLISLAILLAQCSGKKAKDGDDLTKVENKKTTAKVEKKEKGEKDKDEAKAKTTKKDGAKGEEVASVEKETEEKKKKESEVEELLPGSLWSESSHWNRIYSLKSHRKKGDSILIQSDESLRSRISKEIKKALDEERGETQFGDRNIVAVIEKVEGGSSYRVVGKQEPIFAGKSIPIEVSALVREKEISESDSVGSSSLNEVKIKVSKPEEGDEDKEKKKDSKETAEGKKDKGGKEKKEKIVKKKNEDRRTEREKRKQRAIANFDKKKKGTKVAKNDADKEANKEDEEEND